MPPFLPACSDHGLAQRQTTVVARQYRMSEHLEAVAHQLFTNPVAQQPIHEHAAGQPDGADARRVPAHRLCGGPDDRVVKARGQVGPCRAGAQATHQLGDQRRRIQYACGHLEIHQCRFTTTGQVLETAACPS